MSENYDLVIVGSGPAGITAAIYACRYGLNFKIIGNVKGGLVNEAFDIENYPGFTRIEGGELTQKMIEHLKSFDVEIVQDNVKSITKSKDGFTTVGKTEYNSKAVLLALGTERNKLNIPGEKEFCGKGVSYCATCDGFFFNDKTVAVIGGGDAALGTATYLSEIAKKVYLIHRRDEFRADPHWQRRIEKAQNIEKVLEANVVKISGMEKVEEIHLDKDNRKIKVDGVFIEIGETPQSALIDALKLEKDKSGFVNVTDTGKTSLDGVWAAGDLTTGSGKLRQIVTACAEGAVALVDIYAYLKND